MQSARKHALTDFIRSQQCRNAMLHYWQSLSGSSVTKQLKWNLSVRSFTIFQVCFRNWVSSDHSSLHCMGFRCIMTSVRWMMDWSKCCNRKSRAAYAQSFALWQQATIEFTCHDHSPRTLLLRSIVDIVSITRDYTPRSLLLLARATYMYGVVLHAHPVRGESHNQRNTTGEVAT